MPADAVTIEKLQRPVIIGKLPAHGDFVARGVSHSVRDAIDKWLSAWMEECRAKAGEQFNSVYESAAPWLYEGEATTAVLLPSVDAVGRLFPLLAICEGEQVTQEIYDMLIAALEAGMPVDALREGLADLPKSVSGQAHAGWFLPEGAEKDLPSPAEVQGWNTVEGHFA